MLYCKRCQTTKPTSEYRKDSSRKTGFQIYCKSCSSKMCRELDKRPERLVVLASKMRSRVATSKARFDAIKEYLGCACCKEVHIACMDFHHVESDTKELAISQCKHHSWAKLVAEIVKCVCVCANCHRKIHAGVDMGPLVLISKQQIVAALKEKR